MNRRALLAAGGVALSGVGGALAAPVASPRRPIVIAHRGASALRPEHTLSAYRLAVAQGADFVEPDLVLSKDGVLVCRHENEIAGTTDVGARPEFADRRRDKIIDGERFSGWFTEDFTLAELKTLRARERLPELRPQSAAHDGEDQIPTFAEVLELVAQLSAETGRAIGVYPETKHPLYFRELLGPMELPLLADLHALRGPKRAWFGGAGGLPVFIQSFEAENLKFLRTLTALPLVQLISAQGRPAGPGPSYAEMITDAGLREIATYAQGIGVEKSLVLPRDSAGRSLGGSDLVRRAHAARLIVHAWTFRPENTFLPTERRDENAPWGDHLGELGAAYATGLDGVFADLPEAAVRARGE